MTDLFAAVCSIAPTRRRRFLWAAWWTSPPEREPFRKPDAYSGGARSREEALREAERVTGRSLIEIEARWARAWTRVLTGKPPFAKARTGAEDRAATPRSTASRSAEPPRASAWATLGVEPDATVAEIKRAFKRRALETHPDRGGDAETFRAVRRALEKALEQRARPARRRKRA